MTPSTVTGSLTVLNAVVDTAVDTADYVAVQINGTWNGTVTFQASLDNVVWNNVTLLKSSDVDKHAASATTTSNGLFFHETMGVCHFRLKMTSYVSGTAEITVCTKRISK